MTLPFLSIVTISYNQAPYLRRCLDSVASQKSDDVEYIVVDPGSTDESREILREYQDMIDCLLLEPDEGPADGLNKGFSRATGEVGYFINSDDFLLPDAVDHMRRLWSENTEIDVLLGRAWMVDCEGEPIRELCPIDTTLERLLDPAASMVQQGMSFRMNCFRSIGGFNKSNRTCWDYELLCEMLNAGSRLQTASERIGAFRYYEASLSGGASGAVHARRYLADLDRIYMKATGMPRAAPTLLGRVMRQAAKPGHSMRRLRDWISPACMRRRWSRDIKRADKGA